MLLRRALPERGDAPDARPRRMASYRGNTAGNQPAKDQSDALAQ
jgi:hypothetical protein